jgi:ribonuclease Z
MSDVSLTNPLARTPLAHAMGRTRALYANWLWVKDFDLLFDAGDGVAIDMGRYVGSPKFLAITHGHSDHILGLPNLIASRQFGTLTSGGPLTILYPADCPHIAGLRQLLGVLWSRESFDRVTWVPLVAGVRVPLSGARYLETFATEHVGWLPTLGYAVRETRTRLRADVRALAKDALLAQFAEHGKAAFQESFEHTILVHTGDTMPVDQDLFDGADVLLYDTTFLMAADRDYPSHATVDEALAIAQRRRVKTLVLHHVSQRYARATLVDDIIARMPATGGLPRVVLWDELAFHSIHSGRV